MQEREQGLARRRGIALVLVGVVLLLMNLGFFRPFAFLGGVGPFVVFLVGCGFLLVYVLGQEWAVFPGSFATMVGLVIALLAGGWVDGEAFWPAFIVAPGLAFFLIGLLAPEHRSWVAIPGTIVTGVGLVFFSFSLGLLSWNLLRYLGILWPLVLVAIGVKVLLGK